MIKIELVKGDITEQSVDAIVTAANQALRGGGGTDGAVHSACGAELMDELKELGGCSTGNAKMTKAYNMNGQGVGWIIHAVGPRYAGGMYFEDDLLADTYKAALGLTLNYEQAYRDQCLEVLDKYIGELSDHQQRFYRKETVDGVGEYCEAYPIRTLALPSISTGAYGYPLEEAALIASRTIKTFCRNHDHLERVVLVCYDNNTYNAYKRYLG